MAAWKMVGLGVLLGYTAPPQFHAAKLARVPTVPLLVAACAYSSALSVPMARSEHRCGVECGAASAAKVISVGDMQAHAKS